MKFKKRIAASVAAVMLASSAMSASAEVSFSDVQKNKESEFYYQSMQNLVKYNVVKGYTKDNTFRPYQPVNRMQAASFVARALELDLKTNTNIKDPGFKDLSKNNEHYPAIAKLTELGIFEKTEYFRPAEPLTRDDMARILVKAFELESPNIKEFNDVPKNDPNYEFIGTIGALGITVNEGNYNPNGTIYRANFVAFIGRSIEHKRSDNKKDIWDDWHNWVDEKPPANENNKDDEKNDNDDDKNNGNNDKNNDNEKDKETKEIEAMKKKIDSSISDLRYAQRAVDKELDKLDDIKDEIGDIEKLEDKIADLEDDLDFKKDKKRKETDKDKIRNLERDIEDLEDEIEDLEELLEDLEDQKLKLLQELRKLDDLLKEANDLLEEATAMKKDELDITIRSFESAIRSAQRDYDKAYANTFDKDYYEETVKDAIKDLTRAKEKAEGVLKASVGLREIEDKFEDLGKALKEAEKVLDSLKDSRVNLKSLEKELDDLIDEAEDVYDDLEDIIDDKLGSREDYYKEELKEAIDELEDAIDDLEDAIKDKKGVSSARGDLFDEIENAEKVLKNYRDSKLDSLKRYEDELVSLIKKAEELYEESKNK